MIVVFAEILAPCGWGRRDAPAVTETFAVSVRAAETARRLDHAATTPAGRRPRAGRRWLGTACRLEALGLRDRRPWPAPLQKCDAQPGTAAGRSRRVYWVGDRLAACRQPRRSRKVERITVHRKAARR